MTQKSTPVIMQREICQTKRNQGVKYIKFCMLGSNREIIDNPFNHFY